jgi:hypothetical protein
MQICPMPSLCNIQNHVTILTYENQIKYFGELYRCSWFLYNKKTLIKLIILVTSLNQFCLLIKNYVKFSKKMEVNGIAYLCNYTSLEGPMEFSTEKIYFNLQHLNQAGLTRPGSYFGLWKHEFNCDTQIQRILDSHRTPHSAVSHCVTISLCKWYQKYGTLSLTVQCDLWMLPKQINYTDLFGPSLNSTSYKQVSWLWYTKTLDDIR